MSRRSSASTSLPGPAKPRTVEHASEKFFTAKYTEWLQHLVDDYGIGEDVNGDGKVKIKFNENDPHAVPRIEGLNRAEADELFNDPTSAEVTTGHHGHHHGHDHGHGHKYGHHKQHTDDVWFSDSFTIDGGTKTIASADGQDMIDFTWGEDRLDFSGLGPMTQGEFEAAFALTDDGGSTKIALEGDDTWSVTLLGVSGHTEAELYGQITFA